MNRPLRTETKGPLTLVHAERFDDVEEVLSRDEVFFVTYEKKMREVSGNQGNFFLGMQNSPDYQQDVANMRSVVRRDDLADIQSFVTTRAEELMAARESQIDLVADLAKRVPARWFMNYFGCPHDNEDELIEWACHLFRFVFVSTNSPAFDQEALESAAKVRDFLDHCIQDRKAHPVQKDDILARCLALQEGGVPRMSDLDIRNNFLGLLTGAVLTTSSAVTKAIDQLLERPVELAAARKAAGEDNDALLKSYLFEALRFNPMSPGLARFCSQDYVIAKGTERETLVKKGSIVVVGTLSAMFDSSKFDEPGQFRIDRPAHQYLFFGFGLHRCFGQYVSEIQIPAIAKALLKRNDLKRAPGDEGQLQLEGGFPKRLKLQFQPNKNTMSDNTNPTPEGPGNLNPNQKALNLILKVKEPVAQNAAALRAVLKKLTPDGLNNVGTVHFGRFLLMENDTRFGILTEYDNDFGGYVTDFIVETGDVFNALLQFVEHPEGLIPVEENREAFLNYVAEHDIPTEVFYSAYPTRTVQSIKQD
ncbi:cytochrome P450 [Verrucomicrobiaceae bacterium 227]